MMTKDEHMYERMYVHTYVRDRPFILSTTSLCEGIIKFIPIMFALSRLSKDKLLVTETSCRPMPIRHKTSIALASYVPSGQNQPIDEH